MGRAQVVHAGQVAFGADHPVALVPAGRVAAAHVATGSGHDVRTPLVRGPVAYVAVDCIVGMKLGKSGVNTYISFE